MRKLFSRAVIIYSIFGISVSVCAEEISSKSCSYDRKRILGLEEGQFDQDSAGGWRELSSRPGCDLIAADLIRDYRKEHGMESGLLYWHEAQLRAVAGHSKEAVSLMKLARKPVKEDRAGWNLYVDATIAFLRRDRVALRQARSKLASVPPPIGENIPPVVNGFMEVEMDNGPLTKIRWPPNIDVVEGLENCFDKPYVVAYETECRKTANQ